jgi:Clostripain family
MRRRASRVCWSEVTVSRRMSLVVALAVATNACGGGSDGGSGPNPPPDTTPNDIAVQTGNRQTQRVNTALAVAPSVVVKNAAGQPLSGVTVSFTATQGGGSVTGGTATTNAQGIATVGSWVVGPTPGFQSLVASIPGTQLGIGINATARYPHWTIAVYMAADNNLAYDAVKDLDEMEAATRDPEVQVVVQAEYSPHTLAQYGCVSPACIGRPNFNTFRYVLASGTPRPGPDGPATDIGNRNMVDPAQLTEFIQWARATAPSERFLLVPWNHGGGYTGLLADETSSPDAGMSMAGFRTALQAAGGPPIDLVDFDMCLMGAYETLVTLQGLAHYAVFSQETEPGAGNDYTLLLNGIHDANQQDGAGVAGVIADAFYASYAGDRASTTISAYDVTNFGAFDQALSSLASHLKLDLATFGPLVAQAGSGTLRFYLPEVTDVLNFADSLGARVADATIQADLTALRTAGSASNFRLRNHFRNGTVTGFGGTGDVSRATGLHVLLPDVTSSATMGDAGPRSLGSYLGMFANSGWGQFLAAYLASPAVADVTDLGLNRLETYLVWTTESQAAGVDIDLWVLEPDGTIASPYFGSVSPNGTLTSDSYQSGYPVEGYMTNRFVRNGTYVWYAFLTSDPQPVHPLIEFVYRYGSDPFVSVYGSGPYPQLTQAQSILSDPTPTFGEANVGAYSDFIPVANVTFGPAPLVASRRGAAATDTRTLPHLVHERPSAPVAMALRGTPGIRPTQRQMATVRALLEQRHSGVRPVQWRGLAKLRIPESLTSGKRR